MGCEGISEGEVLCALRLALHFSALLGWQGTTIKDNVRLYLVVAEQPDTMHCVVDIPRR